MPTDHHLPTSPSKASMGLRSVSLSDGGHAATPEQRDVRIRTVAGAEEEKELLIRPSLAQPDTAAEEEEKKEEEETTRGPRPRPVLHCQVCSAEKEGRVARYTCPECNCLSCSLECFRVHNPRCTDHFYSRQLEQELKAEPKQTPEEQQRMREILNRVHQQQILALQEDRRLAMSVMHGESRLTAGDPRNVPGASSAAVTASEEGEEEEEEEEEGISEELAEELKQLSLKLAGEAPGSDAEMEIRVDDLSPELRQRFMKYANEVMQLGTTPSGDERRSSSSASQVEPGAREEETQKKSEIDRGMTRAEVDAHLQTLLLDRWHPWWLSRSSQMAENEDVESESEDAEKKARGLPLRLPGEVETPATRSSPGLKVLPSLSAAEIQREYLCPRILLAYMAALHRKAEQSAAAPASSPPPVGVFGFEDLDTEIEVLDRLLRIWPRREHLAQQLLSEQSSPQEERNADHHPTTISGGLLEVLTSSRPPSPPPTGSAAWPPKFPEASLQHGRKLYPGLLALLLAYAHVQRLWTGQVPLEDLPQAVRILLSLPGIFDLNFRRSMRRSTRDTAASSPVNHESVLDMLEWILDGRFPCEQCTSAAPYPNCRIHPTVPWIRWSRPEDAGGSEETTATGDTGGEEEEEEEEEEYHFGMGSASRSWALQCVLDSVCLLQDRELLLRALWQVHTWFQRLDLALETETPASSSSSSSPQSSAAAWSLFVGKSSWRSRWKKVLRLALRKVSYLASFGLRITELRSPSEDPELLARILSREDSPTTVAPEELLGLGLDEAALVWCRRMRLLILEGIQFSEERQES